MDVLFVSCSPAAQGHADLHLIHIFLALSISQVVKSCSIKTHQFLSCYG